MGSREIGQVHFFETPAELRRWFGEQYNQALELWAGFYKKTSGKAGIQLQDAIDEALCFGWIDSFQKGIDETSYAIRFTPRKPNSAWSAINIQRVQELIRMERMQPAGLKAFQKRKSGA